MVAATVYNKRFFNFIVLKILPVRL
jgi:hypothetical protein